MSTAKPVKVKRTPEERSKKIAEDVGTWLGGLVGRKVNVPADLKDGTVIVEAINKLVPNSIKTFKSTPKHTFAIATNYSKINRSLLSFGVNPGDLPVPSCVARGQGQTGLITLLHKLSKRAAKLKVAPEAYVKAAKAKYLARIRLHVDIRAHKHHLLRQRTLGAIRAAKYQRSYRQFNLTNLKKQREAEKKGNFYVLPERRVAFVMRIRGINKVPPKPRKILQLFRLRQLHNAVFVRLNKATQNMLKAIEPYVAIGYPSVQAMRALIIKRGYASINKQRVAITTNQIIHTNLGRYGVHTVDDLIHQLYTGGKYFAQCNRFMWPFKLTSPRGGFGRKGKLRHFVEGGAHGNRMGMINRLIRQCL